MVNLKYISAIFPNKVEKGLNVASIYKLQGILKRQNNGF